MSIDKLKKDFAAKVPVLVAGLKKWFDEETASIDGATVAAAPSGTGGSIISVRPAIDSKRVVDATLVTLEVLNIELPPEIIKPGGYQDFQEMIDHLIPTLEKVFTGELKVKKRKQLYPAEAA